MRAAEAVLLSYLWNSLWMVPLFWFAGEMVGRVLGRERPVVVHRVWVGCVLLEAGFPAVGGLSGWPGLGWMHGAAGVGRVSVTVGPAVVAGVGVRMSAGMAAWVAAGYGLVLGWLLLRLVWGLRRTWRLGREGWAPALRVAEAEMWTRMRARFGCEKAELLESAGVRTPLTVGVMRRRVVLPEGLRARLREEELRAVLAHECAHVRRRDFGWNLLYLVLTLPVAYHPLLWRSRARLAESREWVCDGMAAEAVGTAKVYARTLVRLATLLVGVRPAGTNYAIGVLDANTLERRVMRLTERVTGETMWRRGAKAALCTVLAAAVCGSAWGWRSAVAVPGAGQAEGAAPRTVPSGWMAGQVLSRVAPVYPPEAKAARVQGSVVMHATISKEGAISDLSVVSGPEELRTAAMDSVRQWTYKPYLLNGEPVAVQTVITVNFQLQ